MTTESNKESGWKAALNCNFEPGPDRTIVRRSHKGPLTMQRPFYPEGQIAHVYMLHPPGGVVAGDQLNINVHCSSGAKGLITTPGATKFYRSDSQCANVLQSLCNNGGSLEWFPQENIYFSGCRATVNTVIRLNSGASLGWWDISCFGRIAGNQPFNCGSVTSLLNLYIDGALMLRERLSVEDHYPLGMSCGMRNHCVSGTLLLTPMQPHCLDHVRGIVEHQPQFSATCFDSMLIVRYLGDSSEDAKAGFTQIWSGLRAVLNQSEPIVPRIWAT